ncbi:MAG: hypothetical protein HKN68_08310 [Saprospiraceae bacterium]|nr:hypothetical protein [Saprospiraceae bacterium]
MKNLMCLILISLLSWGCSGDTGPDEIDEELKCGYAINVNNFQYLLEGETVQWSPSIGHLELGPEDPPCCDGTNVCPGMASFPVGSLWMDFNLNVNLTEYLDGITAVDTSTIKAFKFNFYSIKFWCKDLGAQEANWYSQRAGNPFAWLDNGSVSPKFEIGYDNRGLGIIRIEGLRIFMTRDLINENDVPENIELLVNLTAFEICP